jgi:transcriptional regulator of acetoin/glycerol metabolism
MSSPRILHLTSLLEFLESDGFVVIQRSDLFLSLRNADSTCLLTLPLAATRIGLRLLARILAAGHFLTAEFDVRVPQGTIAEGDAKPLAPHQVTKRAEILEALQQSGWSRISAATKLGISHHTLARKMARYGLSLSDCKRDSERARILAALSDSRWNVEEAAQKLGLTTEIFRRRSRYRGIPLKSEAIKSAKVELRREELLSALRETGWNKALTAAKLGISEAALMNRFVQFRLKRHPENPRMARKAAVRAELLQALREEGWVRSRAAKRLGIAGRLFNRRIQQFRGDPEFAPLDNSKSVQQEILAALHRKTFESNRRNTC